METAKKVKGKKAKEIEKRRKKSANKLEKAVRDQKLDQILAMVTELAKK